MELYALDGSLTRCYQHFATLAPEQREKHLQFCAVHLAYLIRQYRDKKLPLGWYTCN